MKRIIAVTLAFLMMFSFAGVTSAAEFKDVGANHSLQVEIEYLASAGVINGYSDGTFKPNAPIAKKHIAAMLVKALNLPTTNLQNPGYADVPTTHPYYKEIAAAYTAGIFSKATYFKPESSISRAFMAKVLAQAFNLKSIANNAVTYTDVPKANAFYTPIQLVTMNKIAQGYSDGQNSQQFKPNQLLTRAHFSAFLARAMSLKAGNYKPDTGYTYYYETIEGDDYRMVFDSSTKEGSATYDYWDLYNEHTGMLMSKDVYILGDGSWVQGVQNSDVGIFSSYPFTVGTKYNTLNDSEGQQERLRILSTHEQVRLAGIRYQDVVIFEEAWPIYNDRGQLVKMNTNEIYIAKDYGIIGVKDSRGYWVTWLTKRER